MNGANKGCYLVADCSEEGSGRDANPCCELKYCLVGVKRDQCKWKTAVNEEQEEKKDVCKFDKYFTTIVNDGKGKTE